MKVADQTSTDTMHRAAGIVLVRVALLLSRNRAGFKRNLATLYEAGAITGADFSRLVHHYELEAV